MGGDIEVLPSIHQQGGCPCAVGVDALRGLLAGHLLEWFSKRKHH